MDISLDAGKVEVREYLKRVNAKGKVSASQTPFSSGSPAELISTGPRIYPFPTGPFPGYLVLPYQTAKHIAPLQIMFDYNRRRAIVIDGHDPTFSFATVPDLTIIVAKSIEYEGGWPVVGGVSGNRVSLTQIINIGQKG